MKKFRIMVSTPSGLIDPSLAIAATRAGEIGILNLEQGMDKHSTLTAVNKLVRFVGKNCAIKLNGKNKKITANIISELPEQINMVILTATEIDSLADQVDMFHNRNMTVLLETTCLEQAFLGEKAGVDGLIAKGHEAGGWVGEETTFILLQALLNRISLPIWAQGGIGLHTAAACYAAGAAGVILDNQLLLTRESPLPEPVKAVVARMDGSETACLGSQVGGSFRMYNRRGLPAVEEIRQVLIRLSRDSRPGPGKLGDWEGEIQQRIGWQSPEQNILPLGQDAAFAAPLARRFITVSGVLEGFRQAIREHVRVARSSKPFHKDAPLARSHKTLYPVVQGPMTRVSDQAILAAKVAEEGALPFLALALMRAPEVKTLLAETQKRLENRSWGVGILGFVPLELRQEQLEVIRTVRPPFALIAGGRPDQAFALEKEGIATYLHVPSPGLLKMFLESGSRRFVFEGRECGGHVGPRTSFVLWNMMINVLLETLSRDEIAKCHILFAGGIHDALSAAMVANIAAPLAARGAKTGILMGTAYLFTEEAINSGAIVEGFQQEALQCERTILLETAAGHVTRCAATPYAEFFEKEKQQLLDKGLTPEKIRDALENLNLGRLRIASKGIKRNSQYGDDRQAPRYIQINQKEQHTEGMYMIGQAAALRNRTCKVRELHEEVSLGASRHLEKLIIPKEKKAYRPGKARPSNVAIIGMACILPQAPDLQTYLENILNKVYAITEIPKDRWDWELYFDPDRHARDKIYSRWGGFIDPVPFDPLEFGMPPNSLHSIDPMQLLALKVAKTALEDAGYWQRKFNRNRTSVILGASGGVGDLGAFYFLRSGLPLLFGEQSAEIISQAGDLLPEWTEDSFAGLLPNVSAGRISNRLDLGGTNYVVDAACASSLAAVHLGVKELESRDADMVIVGGVDTAQSPFGYMCFSKTQALSPNGIPRTFDADADGITISQGIVMLILKRLVDAERDGDRIYAVIKGIGGSSDGKAKGLTAPRPEGQMEALRRAYKKAGVSPTTVGLVEAHGTGTVVGDRTEVLALTQFLEAHGAEPQNCAVGSVKSMIGHTKATAGAAGLSKMALALYHKTLPPTLGISQPNQEANLTTGPLYANTETRPWIHSQQDYPRRAGVSSFGFGGTNFHAVLEEYTGNFLPAATPFQHWPGEIFLLAGESRGEIIERIATLEQAFSREAVPALKDLSYTLWQIAKDRSGPNLVLIAASLDDLRRKLERAREHLNKSQLSEINDPRGIYYTENPLTRDGKVAFLFPGQGSQYPDMLRELSVYFPEVREKFELADKVLAGHFPRNLSSYIFPPPRFSTEEKEHSREALKQTNIAQPALGASSIGLYNLLQTFGLKPDMVAGHSYGEYTALHAAGVFSEEVLFRISEARGRFIIQAATEDLGTMAAVPEEAHQVEKIIDSLEGVWIANLNAPKQTIISGTKTGIDAAVKQLQMQGIQARSIEVSCGFHSPLVVRARDTLSEFLENLEFKEPHLPVFSNSTAEPYPGDPRAIIDLLGNHLTSPVKFAREIEEMYKAGARIFVEVGPRNLLTNLTRQILNGKPHLAASSDVPDRSGVLQLLHTLGQLIVHGVPLQLDRLYHGRTVQQLNLDNLAEETKPEPLPSTIWLVDGTRAKPLLKSADANAAGEGASLPKMNAISIPATPDKTISKSPLNARFTAPKKADVSPPTSETTISPPESSAAVQPGRQPAATNPRSLEDETTRVMMQFQDLMSQFLETQQNVMQAYLQGSAGSLDLPEAPANLADVSEEPFSSVIPESPQSPAMISSEESNDNRGSLPPGDNNGVSVSAAAPPPPEQEPFDKENLTRQLLQIVSDRTGYPTEMIDLDSNMEADLGIDSIKRVEILGTFQRNCLPAKAEGNQETMEDLTGLKTIREIINFIMERFPQGENEAVPALLEQPGVQAADNLNGSDTEVSRFILEPVKIPLSEQKPEIPKGTVFLITDDEGGVARAMAAHLESLGGRAVLLRAGDKVECLESNYYTADFSNPAYIAELLQRVREDHGPLSGIIHLLPLKPAGAFEELDTASWKSRLTLETKSLFYLAKEAGSDLKLAAKDSRAWLLAATKMGGTFANDLQGISTFDPAQGGIPGLIKTLAVEWPEVVCKSVDFEPRVGNTTVADYLLQEMGAGADRAEIGYKDSHRFVLRSQHASLDRTVPEKLEIDDKWVVLVTGGARGITAEVTRELAKQYQPTIIIVGRSPLPEAPETPETAALTAPRELKAALIERMRQGGEQPTPTAVETAYQRLIKAREIAENLAVMAETGARVHYHSVDVSDARAFGEFIDHIYQTYGRLDGVIHGAGILEDKLIEDKTPDSFDRVFDTKVDSAFVLARKLKPAPLKFLVFFSSIAGRFGNRGQGDYAAANEVLNKLALYLNQKWPGRIVAINWGPWAKTGMVSPEIQKQFEKRGVQLIPPSQGKRLGIEEIVFGRKAHGEVIFGNGPWEVAETVQSPPSNDPLPLLKNAFAKGAVNGNTLEMSFVLDPAVDRYLQDHRLDGNPVFPAAMALELMAETVQRNWPKSEVLAIHSFQVLRGIVLDKGAKNILLTIHQQKQPSDGGKNRELTVEISVPHPSNQLCYRAIVQTGEKLLTPSPFNSNIFSQLSPFPLSVEEAYHDWLFHGPLFQGILKIEGMNQEGICGTLLPSSPEKCIPDAAGQWLVDPIVLDSGFQLALLWERAHFDMTPLPSRFQSYLRFGSPGGSPVKCYVKAQSAVGGHKLLADIYFLNSENRLIGLLQDMEYSCSKSLNRLAKYTYTVNG